MEMMLDLNLSSMMSNDEIDFTIYNKVKNEKKCINRRRKVHVVNKLSYPCKRHSTNSSEHPNKNQN